MLAAKWPRACCLGRAMTLSKAAMDQVEVKRTPWSGTMSRGSAGSGQLKHLSYGQAALCSNSASSTINCPTSGKGLSGFCLLGVDVENVGSTGLPRK